jgi:hypothetical protein
VEQLEHTGRAVRVEETAARQHGRLGGGGGGGAAVRANGHAVVVVTAVAAVGVACAAWKHVDEVVSGREEAAHGARGGAVDARAASVAVDAAVQAPLRATDATRTPAPPTPRLQTRR